MKHDIYIRTFMGSRMNKFVEYKDKIYAYSQ